MWLIASIFYAYQYILRVVPSVIFEDIIQQFNMDTILFGQFSGVYYIGYSLMHIPLGIMLDKYGPKKILAFCTALSAAGVFPIIFAQQWIYPTAGRIITGMGSSAAILGVFKIIRMAFDEQRFTRMLSFSITIGLIGAIYGGAPVRSMCDVFGYRSALGVFIFVGFLLAIAIYIIIPETESHTDNSDQSMVSNIRDVFTNLKAMLLCVSAGLMVGPLEGFADIWGPKFLEQMCGIEKSTASHLTSLIFIGMCFGAPVLNFIAEKLGHLKTIILSGLIMFAVFLILVMKMLNTTSITICFIIVGVCSAYQILAVYKASTYVNKHIANLITTVANMIIMTFGYIIHSTIGATINLCNRSGISSAFCLGIAVIPAALLMGTIGFVIVFCMDARSKKNNLREMT
jgi:predicted MFS family arabinose efflux permease